MRLWLPYILLAAFAGADVPADMAGEAEQLENRPVARTGDEITLKSGKVLHGLKIVRKTPIALTLEIIPGVDPLVIPAKQVASIKIGALDPRYDQPPAPATTREEKLRVDVLPATRTSSELLEKMGAPFTDEQLLYESQDIVSILYSVAIMSSVPVAIDTSVENRPPAERKVTLTLDPGTTMDHFVDEVLAEEAPWLRVRFELDTLHFEARKTSSGRKAGRSGPPDEARRPGVDTTGP